MEETSKINPTKQYVHEIKEVRECADTALKSYTRLLEIFHKSVEDEQSPIAHLFIKTSNGHELALKILCDMKYQAEYLGKLFQDETTIENYAKYWNENDRARFLSINLTSDLQKPFNYKK